MNIRSKALALIVLATFTAGIGITMAFNLWITESTKIPARYVSGEFAGEFNPADIRGSYSFDDIQRSFAVPVDILAQAFGVSNLENPADFQAKDLETMYSVQVDGGEIGTDAVRLFVARYLDLPYTPQEDTRLPSPAVAQLKEKLSTAEYEAMRMISVRLADVAPQDHDESEYDADMTVKGKTTFDDLIQWGLTKEEIETILGLAMGPRSMTIRDFVMNQGLEFTEYKSAFQELLDGKR